ncbi:dihydroorotate dehydrogenase-like protein [Myxococcota bacterium]|jgi:dihydroorotate dehydrogenase (fumarate)|nr:dihydroorotate dehydrogenase-like protein [Myxococcota bacterium]
MADLSTSWMGIPLRSPLVVASSGLTRRVEDIRACEAAGAGAVVMKSVFEEQILAELRSMGVGSIEGPEHSEGDDYVARYGRRHAIDEALETLRRCRREVGIPVIASIHCATGEGWEEFAIRAAEAGAAAIELNVFVPPMSPDRDGASIEQTYFDVARTVRRSVGIPVALKIAPFFSGLARTAVLLSREVHGLVLFNRFVHLDIDLDRLEVVTTRAFSQPGDLESPLRWTALLAGRVHCDLAVSTGVHDGEGAAKALLAGAAAVQVCSALYRHGVGHLQAMADGLIRFMDRHHFACIADFRGRLAQSHLEAPEVWERAQFIKIQAGIE